MIVSDHFLFKGAYGFNRGVSDVFNTEAHPFKAPAAQPTYDSGSLTINTTSVFETISGTLPAVSPNVHISGVEV